MSEIIIRNKNGIKKRIEVVEKPVITATTAAELTELEYRDYLLTPHFKRIRAEAFESAGHKCVVCNSADRLVGHHRTYERYGCERPGDVQCLCERCHNLFHRRVSFGRQGNFGDRKNVTRKKSFKRKGRKRKPRKDFQPRENHNETLDHAFDRWMAKD